MIESLKKTTIRQDAALRHLFGACDVNRTPQRLDR